MRKNIILSLFILFSVICLTACAQDKTWTSLYMIDSDLYKDAETIFFKDFISNKINVDNFLKLNNDTNINKKRTMEKYITEDSNISQEPPVDTVIVTDTVSCENLSTGTTYILSGKLVSNTNETSDTEHNIISEENIEFVATSEDMIIDMNFAVDIIDVNEKMIVYEELHPQIRKKSVKERRNEFQKMRAHK